MHLTEKGVRNVRRPEYEVEKVQAVPRRKKSLKLKSFALWLQGFFTV